MVLLWPTIAILVKRLHDIGLSGWWSLAWLAVPYLAPTGAIAPLLLIILAIVGLLPGSNGGNRFGAQSHTIRKV